MKQKPISAVVTIPGSKSITNRALLMASLCKEPVVLKKALISDDTIAMIECLKSLGVKITGDTNTLKVTGTIWDNKAPKRTLNAQLSGTTLRFLLPLLCIIPGEKILHGEQGLNNRPIKHLVDSLKALGADITYLEKVGHPPVLIKQTTLTKKPVIIKGIVSSQYLSSLLIALPFLKAGSIKVEGALVSKPYVDLTIALMQEFGIRITTKKPNTFNVSKNQTYKRPTPYNVEGDFSSACYFAALAALTGSTIHMKNLNPKSVQGDRQFFDILKAMGNRVVEKSNSIIVEGTSIAPIKINMESCPDQVQTLAVLAAFAKGTTVVSGIQTLRIKETDRVAALQTELKKMGIKTAATQKTLTIIGGSPRNAQIETYGDHRMAMSFALAGARLKGLTIKNPEVVSKTFPDFWSKMKTIGV